MTTTSPRSTSTHATEVAALPRRRRLMARLDISHDGVRYWYNGYRYDRLTDAVTYALLTRARRGSREPGTPHTQRTVVAAPSDGDRAPMASLAIEFDAGAYRFGNCRYDRLVNDARCDPDVRCRTDASARREPNAISLSVEVVNQ